MLGPEHGPLCERRVRNSETCHCEVSNIEEIIKELEKSPLIRRYIYTGWSSEQFRVYFFERWTATYDMLIEAYEHRLNSQTVEREDVESTTDTRGKEGE